MTSPSSDKPKQEGRPSVQSLLPDFYRQVDLFGELGQTLDSYVNGARQMRAAMAGVHKTILSMCGTSWPRRDEFERLLEDQTELWNILEMDVHKLRKGFQYYGDHFNLTLRSIHCRMEKMKEIGQLKNSLEKMKISSRVKSQEKVSMTKLINDKISHIREVDERLLERIKEVIENQKNFIVEEYGKFLKAQSDFCKDNLAVLNFVPDILAGFLPKPKYRLRKTTSVNLTSTQ